MSQPPIWSQKGLPTHQKAEIRSSPPTGSAWRYEIKWDGYRAFCVLDDNPWMISSNGNDLKQPKLAKHIADAVGRNCILDGEIVWLDRNGRSDFGILRKDHLYRESSELTFVVFDVIKLDDWDLRGFPLTERLRLLSAMFEEARSPRVFISPALEGDPGELMDGLCAKGLEGMIAKNLNSTYRGIRTSEWQKIKCRRKDRGFVVGYTLLLNNDHAMGALVIGELQDGKMVHIGRVGTGFKAEDRLTWFKRLKPMEIDRHDVHNLRKEDVKGVRWVRPEIQIKFEMAERTNDGLLRQASFGGEWP